MISRTNLFLIVFISILPACIVILLRKADMLTCMGTCHSCKDCEINVFIKFQECRFLISLDFQPKSSDNFVRFDICSFKSYSSQKSYPVKTELIVLKSKSYFGTFCLKHSVLKYHDYYNRIKL